MAYSPIELLTVYLDARNQRRKVGRLAFKDRWLLFEYEASFIASGIEISPIKLPLGPGVSIADTTIFDGLFGVFNDSLPDGWGRLLLDRTVEKHGIHRGQLNSARPACLCGTARDGRSQLRAGAESRKHL